MTENSEESKEELGQLSQKIKDKFASFCVQFHNQHGDETVVVKKEIIHELCAYLKDDSAFKMDMMMDLTAVDYLEQKRKDLPRFEVVYHFKSIELGHRIRVKCGVEESDPKIDTISDLWMAVDWYERECFDMYGITFTGHPNMVRILMYDNFKGHPLRKDYAIEDQQPLVPMRKVEERYNYDER